MAVIINWMRRPDIEEWLNHERYDWTYEPVVPLRNIDLAHAADNPTRVFLKFDEGNADGILMSVLDGLPLPPVILFDNKNPQLDVGDGVHRLSVCTDLAKKDGVSAAAAYIVANASPARQQKLAARMNINNGRQISERDRLALACQWLKDGVCTSVDEAAHNVGLKPRDVAAAWKQEQIIDRAMGLSVGDIFRDRILDRDGVTHAASIAIDAIKNDVLYVGVVRLCEKYDLSIKEMVGTAHTINKARTEAEGQTLLQAADDEFAERDAIAAAKTKGKKSRLSRGKKYFRFLRSADGVGPVPKWGLDGEDEREYDNMLAVLDRIDRKNEEARKWILRLKEEARKVAAKMAASHPGATPSGHASPGP